MSDLLSVTTAFDLNEIVYIAYENWYCPYPVNTAVQICEVIIKADGTVMYNVYGVDALSPGLSDTNVYLIDEDHLSKTRISYGSSKETRLQKGEKIILTKDVLIEKTSTREVTLEAGDILEVHFQNSSSVITCVVAVNGVLKSFMLGGNDFIPVKTLKHAKVINIDT